MKTLIAIPCMDMIHTVFFKSVIGMNRVGACKYSMTCSSLVYDARNALVKEAVAEGFDRILWLDSDMDFAPDLMNKLMQDMDELNCDIVSGLYFKRRAPVEPVCYKEVGYFHSEELNEVTPIAIPYSDYPRDQVFEVQGCGFGGVLMTVDIAEKVEKKYGVPFAPIIGFGEDLSFCLRARDLGAKIYCDSRIKLGHVGLGTITEEVYLNQKR